MRSYCILLVVSLLVVVSLSAVSPAEAGRNDNRDSTQTMEAWSHGDTVQVGVHSRSERHSVQGGRTAAWVVQCRWEQMGRLAYLRLIGEVVGDGDAPVTDVQDPDEPWVVVLCPVTADTRAINPGIAAARGVLTAYPLGERPPADAIDVLIAQAYESLRVPAPFADAAPVGDADAPMITQLPTWLWVDEAVWAPVSSPPAAIPGLSVVATATPEWALWSGGDDGAVRCDGPGTPYDLGLPADAQHSECTTTFRHSSAVADHTLAVTITWSATYRCSAWCGTGALPDLQVTSTRPVRVAELQAIVTGFGDAA